MTEPFTPPDTPDADRALARVGRLALRARLALVWEQAWPEALALALVGAAFVFAAWLGLFVELPLTGRVGALALFALAGLYALYRIARIAWTPSRAEALSRIDRDSGVKHRPAATLDDSLANTGADPATAALWRLHRARALAAAAKLKVAAPSPRMVARDRYALRAAALMRLRRDSGVSALHASNRVM